MPTLLGGDVGGDDAGGEDGGEDACGGAGAGRTATTFEGNSIAFCGIGCDISNWRSASRSIFAAFTLAMEAIGCCLGRGGGTALLLGGGGATDLVGGGAEFTGIGGAGLSGMILLYSGGGVSLLLNNFTIPLTASVYLFTMEKMTIKC